MDYSLDATAEQWLALWEASPQRSIFSHPKFLAVLPVTVRYAMVWNAGGDCVGVPLCLRGDGRPVPPEILPCLYLGIHARLNVKGNHSRYARQLQLLAKLLEVLTREYSELYLLNSWRMDDLRAVQWHNYHTPEQGVFDLSLGYTAVLSLGDHAGFDQYLKTIRPCRRQEYAKALASPLEFSSSAGPDELLELYRLMFEAQGNGVSDAEADFLRAICSAVAAAGLGAIAAYRDAGRLVAATVFLVDDRSAYYLFGMTAPKYRQRFLNTALLLESIRGFYPSGIAELDFIGVNSPNRGDYKISFNPVIKPYMVAHYVRKANAAP